MNKNIVEWFEIPVENMDRAIKFYESILGLTLTKMDLGALIMAVFPHTGDATGSGGALVQHPDFYKPSTDGCLLYLSAPSGDLSNEMGKVTAAGGQVLMEKKSIAEDVGFMGLFIDSEGNRMAFHSVN